ncbi:MAG: hypothetical protein ABI423_02045 [Burkholderiales bacterium]
MNMLTPAKLINEMTPVAKAKYSSDAAWALAAGVPKETLSRLKRQASCDLRTLGALARAAGCTLTAVPAAIPAEGQGPEAFGREQEEKLLDLCASGNADPSVWRKYGPSFLMGGLAVMLSAARGFDRERYLRLADKLHTGVSTPEVFRRWLESSPMSPSRFLPMVRTRRQLA